MTEQYCTIHRGERGELHCDGCHRFFCRQCVVSRYAFNDSTVWMCKTCAGVRRTLRGEPPLRDEPQTARAVLWTALIVGLVLLGIIVVPVAPSLFRQGWLLAASMMTAPAAPTAVPVTTAGQRALLFSPAKVERHNGELVALGTVRNGADRSATSIAITVTFTDAAGQVLAVGQTQITALGIDQQRDWQVKVPYQQAIVGAGSSAQVSW